MPHDAEAVLPDVLAPDLDILFCGTAAGTASALLRAYYAGPGNAFWPTLCEVGLTPHAVRPQEYRTLIRWNMGLTDLAKNVSGSDQMLAPSHFDAQRLRSLIAEYRPRIVAFTGKRAAAAFLGRLVGYGLSVGAIAGTQVFVLPSPSGAARRYWNIAHWKELERLRGELRGAGRKSAATGSIASPSCARSSAG